MIDSAAEMIGDLNEFVFLAQADVVVATDLRQTWSLLEDDHRTTILEQLSPRFVKREILDDLRDGYACATLSRGKYFRRTTGFTSVVHQVAPSSVVERQLGDRTDLLCITDLGAVPSGTQVTYTQSYLPKNPSFKAAQLVEMMRRRAEDLVQAHVAAIGDLCGRR